jgi:DnaK suppressor protein
MAKSKATATATARKATAKKAAAKKTAAKPAAKKAPAKKAAPAKKTTKAAAKAPKAVKPVKAPKATKETKAKAPKAAKAPATQKPAIKTPAPAKAAKAPASSKTGSSKTVPPKAVPSKTVTSKTTVKAAQPAEKEAAKVTKATAKSSNNNSGGPAGVLIPPDYNPAKDKGDFMNPVMKEYFRLKLIRWREELLRESSETIHNTLQGTELQKPDLADRASAETDHALELRTRDRERKLISKINEALLRLDDDTYGYCEETGEPIAVARLDARPIATLSIEAQERHERMEKTHRDD